MAVKLPLVTVLPYASVTVMVVVVPGDQVALRLSITLPGEVESSLQELSELDAVHLLSEPT